MVETFPTPLTPEEAAVLIRRRRGRNIAMLAALLCLSLLFYAIAMVKMSKTGVMP